MACQTPLQELSASFLDQMHRDILPCKIYPEKKLAYVTRDHWENLIIISISRNNHILSDVNGAKFFVSSGLYDGREKFSRGIEGNQEESCSALGNVIKQSYVYEIELKDQGANVQQGNFILPEYK